MNIKPESGIATPSPPPFKKQKMQNPPTVFHVPGVEADACLEVFGRHFHVHSAILKMHSRFFRDSLSSIENDTGTKAVSNEFRHFWVTKVVQESIGWYLVPASSAPQVSEDDSHFYFEILGFQNVLCAMYTQPYTLNVRKFLSTVKIAECYGALPILSRTLDGAMINSKNFTSTIRLDSASILEAAAKIRSQLLFRESLVWVVSQWSKREDQLYVIKDDKLRKIAINAYRHFGKKVADLQQNILMFSALCATTQHPQRPKHGRLQQLLVEASLASYDKSKTKVFMPKYFRLLHDSGLLSQCYPASWNAVVQNNLVLSGQGFKSGD